MIEEAVEYVEDAMDMALPTNHVIVPLEDTGVIRNFAGVNYGEAIAYVRKGEDGSDWDRAAFRKGMVREVAHYFWRRNEDWIDEEMANTIEQNYVKDVGFPDALTTTERKGCTAGTLQELSGLQPGYESPQFQCNYYLGEKLFLDLQRELGTERFMAEAQGFYRLSRILDKDDLKAGIKEVEEAFGEGNPVIARHWTGKAPETATAHREDSTPVPPRSAGAPHPTPANTAHTPGTTAPPAQSAPPLEEFRTVKHLTQSFTISYPKDWTEEGDKSRLLVRDPENPDIQIEVIGNARTASEPLASFAERYQRAMTERGTGWEQYELLLLRDARNPDGMTILFRRKKTASSCTEDGLIHLHRSELTEERPRVFAVAMSFCNGNDDYLQRVRDKVMFSFTEEPLKIDPTPTPHLPPGVTPTPTRAIARVATPTHHPIWCCLPQRQTPAMHPRFHESHGARHGKGTHSSPNGNRSACRNSGTNCNAQADSNANCDTRADSHADA